MRRLFLGITSLVILFTLAFSGTAFAKTGQIHTVHSPQSPQCSYSVVSSATFNGGIDIVKLWEGFCGGYDTIHAQSVSGFGAKELWVSLTYGSYFSYVAAKPGKPVTNINSGTTNLVRGGGSVYYCGGDQQGGSNCGTWL